MYIFMSVGLWLGLIMVKWLVMLTMVNSDHGKLTMVNFDHAILKFLFFLPIRHFKFKSNFSK